MYTAVCLCPLVSVFVSTCTCPAVAVVHHTSHGVGIPHSQVVVGLRKLLVVGLHRPLVGEERRKSQEGEGLRMHLGEARRTQWEGHLGTL